MRRRRQSLLGIIAAAMAVAASPSLSAQSTRWVMLGIGGTDTASIDTVGIIRTPDLVAAWVRFRSGESRAIPGVAGATYTASLLRYRADCRLRVFDVAQTLYIDSAGATRGDGYLHPVTPPTHPTLAPAPESWAELVVTGSMYLAHRVSYRNFNVSAPLPLGEAYQSP